jgi:threonine/homoserine/homoserine lactone efflux protein
MLFLGLFFLLKKREEPAIAHFTGTTSFNRGLFLAFLNPQLLPFWFAILVYINGFIMIETFSDKIAFASGTAAGALALLVIYARLTYLYKERIIRLIKNANFDSLMGWTYILLCLIKLFSILKK